jgi:hypothetical protein
MSDTTATTSSPAAAPARRRASERQGCSSAGRRRRLELGLEGPLLLQHLLGLARRAVQAGLGQHLGQRQALGLPAARPSRASKRPLQRTRAPRRR